MTNLLHESLDDLVAAVPGHVVSDRLAEVAWRAGRRRRIGRRIAGVALAIGIAAMAAALIPSLVDDLRPTPPADHPNGARVHGYPQRIGHQWLVRDLPDRPGPMAGLMWRGADTDSWYVLSETGRRWRIPMGRRKDDPFPTISPDGRRLGYLVDALGPYVIRDLVTGERVEFPEIASGWGLVHAKYMFSGQQPAFWTADGSRLVLHASPVDRDGALVLDVSGSVQEVAAVEGTLAGFSGPDRLVWIPWPEEGATIPATGPTALITALDGTEVRRLPLRFGTPWQSDDGPNQWSAVTSPDGQELLIMEDRGMSETVVRRFSLRDGAELAPTVPVSIPPACGAGWAGSTPTVPTLNADNAATALIDDGQVRPIVVVEPGEDVLCLIWASEALTGRAHGGLLGLATGWWSWWWREIVLALLAVTMLRVLLQHARRRRENRVRGRSA